MRTKYNIGDKVRIKHGKYRGKIGIIEKIADFRIYGRRTFMVTIDKNNGGSYVSYELELISQDKNEFLEKVDDNRSKVVLVFESDIFKKFDSKTVQNITQNATKINIGNVVLKNRYGDVDVKEKVLYISLKEAQKMYKAGGYHKEFALKLFSEDELNPKPKVPHTWDEYCDNFYPYEHHMHYPLNFAYGFCKDDCDALIAYGKLIRLRRAWVGSWIPDYTTGDIEGIIYDQNPKFKEWPVGPRVYSFRNEHQIVPLSFPTRKMAIEFCECFKNLLEKSKGLY